MLDLITLTDLDARKVEYEDTDQANAAIADASAIARLHADGALDAVEAPNAPAAVVAVVVAMVRRGLANPRGLAQESLGDYSFSVGGQGPATIYATARERKMLRRAVGALGIGGVDLDAPLPVQPSELASEATFDPDDPDA